MSDETLLSVESLTLTYGRGRKLFASRQPDVRALDGVSLRIKQGEIHGLAGESGSGKSSLARCLVGLESPDSGKVLLKNHDILQADSSQQQARRSVQLIFQDPGNSLSPRRTIAQIIAEPAQHFGLDHSDGAIERTLNAVGLDAAAMSRRPNDFSSGQRQRIAIARALICEPDILIADEALSSLDVSVQAQILDLMHELCDKQALSILLVSHDLAVLKENADRLSIMYQGRIVEQGGVQAVFDDPTHPYTQELLASLPRLDPASPMITGLNPGGLSSRANKTGCAFQPNCPKAMERCTSVTPGTYSVSGDADHRVECHLLDPALSNHHVSEGNT